jgi:hypothetical protein
MRFRAVVTCDTGGDVVKCIDGLLAVLELCLDISEGLRAVAEDDGIDDLLAACE